MFNWKFLAKGFLFLHFCDKISTEKDVAITMYMYQMIQMKLNYRKDLKKEMKDKI